MKKLFLISIIILLIIWIVYGCKTTKIDHKTGDVNPTWAKVKLDNVHKVPWKAGNDLITPGNFKPVKGTVKK